MSRSRRKNPCHAVASVRTSWFKRYEHKAFRRRQRQVRDGDEAPHLKEFGNPWVDPRDGKVWRGSGMHPKGWRK